MTYFKLIDFYLNFFVFAIVDDFFEVYPTLLCFDIQKLVIQIQSIKYIPLFFVLVQLY